MLYSKSPRNDRCMPSSSAKLLASVLAILAFTGCDEASQTQGPIVESGQVLVSPEPEADRVALATQVKVRFAADRDVQYSDELLVVTLNGKPVDGQVTYSDRQQQVTFLPTQILEPNSEYRVTLAETSTIDGEVTPAQTWSFETTADVGLTPQWVLDSCMSDEDIAHLSAVNKMRAQGECGDSRFEVSQPLIWHCDVAFVAAEHAADLSRMGIVSAYGSDGKSPVERLTAATDITWRGVAENSFALAEYEFSSAVDKATETAEHCVNLLSPALSHLGSASTSAPDGSEIWVQLLVAQ